jgi:hypothetical protein
MPYMVSAYLTQSYVYQSSPTAGHNAAPFNSKVYVPDDEYYQFLTWIGSDAYANSVSIRGQPAGFYERGSSIQTAGVTGPPPQWVYLPLGTYDIKTSCARIVMVSGVPTVQWLYQGADTGLTIEVVGAPPPEPNIFVNSVMVSPYTVSVGEPVQITVVVTNSGKVSGSLTVTTEVNGTAIDTRTVTRQPGEYTGFFLSYTPEQPGQYLVEAGGKTRTFTATS